MFIEVTRLDNKKKVLVNLDLVKSIYVDSSNQTRISFGDSSWDVKESYDEIKALAMRDELTDIQYADLLGGIME